MVDLQIKHYDYHKQRSYAPRIPEQKWHLMRPIIHNMFQQKLRHSEILRKLRHDHAFRVSEGQLRDQLQRWNMRRYKLDLVRPGFNNAQAEGDNSQLYKLRTVYFDNLSAQFRLEVAILNEKAYNSYLSWKVQQLVMAETLLGLVTNVSGSGVVHYLCQFVPNIASDLPTLSVHNLPRLPQQAKKAYLTGFTYSFKKRLTDLELRQFQDGVIQYLQRAFGEATQLDRCDIGIFHIILCLAAESILHGDQKNFEKHQNMASQILEGILHYWGNDSHKVFENAINSLQSLGDMRLWKSNRNLWLVKVFTPPSCLKAMYRSKKWRVHGCLQYDCNMTHIHHL